MLEEMKSDELVQKSDNNPYIHSIPPLTNGLLKFYEPSLVQIEKVLNELTDKESVLVEQVHSENLALAESHHSDELHKIFNKMEQYQTKLINIKKDMKSLHDKSVKLKKRALKIQQFRERREYLKQQKESEIKMEQDLIGKLSIKNT